MAALPDDGSETAERLLVDERLPPDERLLADERLPEVERLYSDGQVLDWNGKTLAVGAALSALSG